MIHLYFYITKPEVVWGASEDSEESPGWGWEEM